MDIIPLMTALTGQKPAENITIVTDIGEVQL
jgi:hypothetical protein